MMEAYELPSLCLARVSDIPAPQLLKPQLHKLLNAEPRFNICLEKLSLLATTRDFLFAFLLLKQNQL